MKSESFDQAHSGRCPGCGIVDNGNHWGHRYQAMTYMFDSTIKRVDEGRGSKAEIKELEANLKWVARFHDACRKDLELSLKTH